MYIYSIEVLKAKIDPNNGKVFILCYISLQKLDTKQTDSNVKPTICLPAVKINLRYCLNFNGNQHMVSNIDLNSASGATDIVNIVIVYKIDTHDGSYSCRNGVFAHDNRGFDKFVAFSPDGELLISGTRNSYIII